MDRLAPRAGGNVLLDLLLDNRTVPGKLVSTAAVLVLAVLLAVAVGRLAAWRVEDAYSRYYTRKAAHYLVGLVAIVVVALIWRAFAGRIGVVLGLAAAGVAFAMQEVIGALAGWVNVVSGRIFRVGDRIQMGGVQGDVIDLTPLRTKIMEIGSASEDGSWVKGRQYTGRIVAVSNKATFTEPVYNYSSVFEFIWEELAVPVAYRSDWRAAERILDEEAMRASGAEGAQEAMRAMARRYPVPRAELEPRVFARATDNWMELSARFVVPVRTARSVKDAMTRRVWERLNAEGIEIASETAEVTVRDPGPAG
jgi:small-conductance mechanosensitive channel